MNLINKEIANNVFEIFNTKPKVVRYANDDNNKSIDIVICNNSPRDGVSSFATIGLFNTDINLKNNDKVLRTEILAACASDVAEFSNIISTAAFEIMDSNTAYPGFILNDIVSLYNGNTDMKHILLTYPFLWENINTVDFDKFILAFLMAIPISDAERDFCNEHGLDALETIFDEKQIDIFDIYRKSTI